MVSSLTIQPYKRDCCLVASVAITETWQNVSHNRTKIATLLPQEQVVSSPKHFLTDGKPAILPEEGPHKHLHLEQRMRQGSHLKFGHGNGTFHLLFPMRWILAGTFNPRKGRNKLKTQSMPEFMWQDQFSILTVCSPCILGPYQLWTAAVHLQDNIQE